MHLFPQMVKKASSIVLIVVLLIASVNSRAESQVEWSFTQLPYGSVEVSWSNVSANYYGEGIQVDIYNGAVIGINVGEATPVATKVHSGLYGLVDSSGSTVISGLPSGARALSLRDCRYSQTNITEAAQCEYFLEVVEIDSWSEADSLESTLALDRYDIYYGDFNQDGIDGDVYFHGKDQFIPIMMSDLLVPLIRPAQRGFSFYRKGAGSSGVSGNFGDSLQISTSSHYSGPFPQDLDIASFNNAIRAEEGEDYFFKEFNGDGVKDVLVRGVRSGIPALVVLSNSEPKYPEFAEVDLQTDFGVEGFDISDRSQAIELKDINGDGLVDIVMLGGGIYADRIYYTPSTLSATSSVFSHYVDTSPVYEGTNLAGASEGSFRVDESGAATYGMAITVPAGTAGVVPSVSIGYSSLNGNGIMGMGWSLNAYSAISLCPKTLVQDGMVQELLLDRDFDGLCLDGQRLVADGATGYYRTAIDSFVRVKEVGSYYTVEAKDGSLKVYGQTVVDRQSSDGATISWALSKSCDSVGNCIQYHYDQDNGSDFRVSKIEYAFGSSSTPNAIVDFVYQNRVDVSSGYVSGHEIESTKRLSQIKVSASSSSGGQLEELRRYSMVYERHSPSDAYTRSYIAGIQECVVNECLAPTKFDWIRNQGNQFGDASPAVSIALEPGHSFIGDFIPFDFNGDGFQDIAWVEADHVHANSRYNGLVRYALYKPSTQSYELMAYSDGKLYRYVSGNNGGSVASPHGRVRLQAIDYNADGRMDLAVYATHFKRWSIYLSKPDSSTHGWRLDAGSIEEGYLDASSLLLDVDSDGLLDILSHGFLRKLQPSGDSLITPYKHTFAGPVYWDYTPRSSFFIWDDSEYETLKEAYRILPAGDVNGDGASDVILVHKQFNNWIPLVFGPNPPGITCMNITEHYYVMVNDGTGNNFKEFAYLGGESAELPSSGSCDKVAAAAPKKKIQVTNFNNDAYSDIFFSSGSSYFSFLSDGKQFVNLNVNSSGTGASPVLVFSTETDLDEAVINFVDMTGDGYSDLLVSESKYRPWDVASGSFDSTLHNTGIANELSTNQYFFLDATGDGHLDYIRIYDDFKLEVNPNQVTGANDIVTRIETGLGASTSIHYEMLNHTDHYSSVEDALTDLQAASLTGALTPHSSGSYISQQAYYEYIRNSFGRLSQGQSLLDTIEAPAFEYLAPRYVVTDISSSTPSSATGLGDPDGSSGSQNTSSIQYYYSENKIQAGGVGSLGFKTTSTREPQSEVVVQTQYSQEWPFIGIPLSTTSFAPSEVQPLGGSSSTAWSYRVERLLEAQSSSGIYSDLFGTPIQSIKLDHWKMVGWASNWKQLAQTGTKNLGPIKLYRESSESVSFSFETDPSDPTKIRPLSGSGVCSALTSIALCDVAPQIDGQKILHQNVTSQVYDSEGNPTAITAVSNGDGLRQTKHSAHEYDSKTVSFAAVDGIARASTSYRALGRITKATVTDTQERPGQTVVTTSNVSSFTYYQSGLHAGLLKSETVFDGAGNEFEKTTEYAYDNFGNKNNIITQAEQLVFDYNGFVQSNGLVERSARTVYEPSGRYVSETYKDFGTDSEGEKIEKLIEQVLERAPNGAATKVSSGITNALTTIEFDALGRQIASYNNMGNAAGTATGNWSETDYLKCSSALACPASTAFVIESRSADGAKGRTYIDILGRTIREGAMDGTGTNWVYVDTQYDSLGRVLRTSQPFNQDTVPQYWSESQYDVLGRVIKTRAPDGGENSFVYKANQTISTNALLQTKTETHNGLGELIQVEDHLGGKLEYKYNNLGHMYEVRKTAANDDGYVANTTVVTTLSYDALGRKIGMNDADKGQWQYAYNAFGELLWQKDANDQVVLQTYDDVGRMSTRTDYKSASEIEQFTRWYYDGATDDASWTIPNAIGQISAVIMTKGITPINTPCTLANNALQCSYATFDGFGRSQENTVESFADGKSLGEYVTSVVYDSLGRVTEQHDAAEQAITKSDGTLSASGTRNHYHPVTGRLEKVSDLASGNSLYHVLDLNERGQAKRVAYGNGVTASYTYYPETGLPSTKVSSDSLGNTVQKLAYNWDVGGNLSWRSNYGAKSSPGSKSVEESFCYDGLNRLTRAYSGTKTGSCSAGLDGGATAVTITEFDGFGNIRDKYTRTNYNASETQTGMKTYAYGVDANGNAIAGPHAVTSAFDLATNSRINYQYDDNGNLLSDSSGRTLQYSTFDKPISIQKGGHITEFAYGAGRGRYWRKDTSQGQVTETVYLGGIERITKGSSVTWKRYIGGVALYEVKTGTNNQLLSDTAAPIQSYLFKDHLGSIDVITDGSGNVVESLNFDAWGERRKPDSAQAYTAAEKASSTVLNSTYSVFSLFNDRRTTKGFTGHETLDEVGLVHMNGRIYDPMLGRFMQADPFIQASTNTQSYNRYSYTFNNPLNATDPSGFISSLGFELQRGAGTIVAIAATIWCNSCGPGVYAMIAAGSAAMNGADAKGILLAAVAAYAVGSIAKNSWQPFEKVASSALVGGITGVLSGGKFGYSFVAAGMGSFFGNPDIINVSDDLLRVGLAAAVGGTTSELTGGKFKNGAGTAALFALVQVGKSGGKKVDADYKYDYAFAGDGIENMSPEERQALAEMTDEALNGKVSAQKEAFKFEGKIAVKAGKVKFAVNSELKVELTTDMAGAEVGFSTSPEGIVKGYGTKVKAWGSGITNWATDVAKGWFGKISLGATSDQNVLIKYQYEKAAFSGEVQAEINPTKAVTGYITNDTTAESINNRICTAIGDCM